MLTRTRRDSLIAAIALLVASAFFATSIIGCIVHQHKSLYAEATCPICHLSHRVAVPAIAPGAVSVPRPLSGKIVPPRSVCRLIPDFSHLPTRAPPAA